MRSAALGLALVLVATVGSAHAHSIAQLEQKVAKYASAYPDVRKQACVCREGVGRSGVLRYAIAVPNLGQRRIHVWCDLAVFDAAGTQTSWNACDTFLPLAK